jgi:hypothetical protein
MDYIQGAMKIRYGQEIQNVSKGYSNKLNPLKYEPVFLVIEKDLLTSVTNDDIDEDGIKDTWEINNSLSFVNADDAQEDSDGDGLTNLQEYNNGTNSTNPHNPDSDGDGYNDGDEVTAGTNPNDENDYPKVQTEFPLTLVSTTSKEFNISWEAPTGATKYKLCLSSIDEISYDSAQRCNSLIDGYFFDSTIALNMSFSTDATGNALEQNTTYYFRVVAYNDSDEVIGVSSLVSGKLASNNVDTNLSKGLVVHYTFDEDDNATIVHDSSGNGNNGVAHGGVQFVDGVIGKAGSFDGVDDYILVPDSSTFPNNAITLSYWINRDSIPTYLDNYISKELSFQSYLTDVTHTSTPSAEKRHSSWQKHKF